LVVNKRFYKYPVWKDASYLLIAKIFISQKQNFQAKATLISIIENSCIASTQKEAKVILKTLPKE
jgi:hypothetical protein